MSRHFEALVRDALALGRVLAPLLAPPPVVAPLPQWWRHLPTQTVAPPRPLMAPPPVPIPLRPLSLRPPLVAPSPRRDTTHSWLQRQTDGGPSPMPVYHCTVALDTVPPWALPIAPTIGAYRRPDPGDPWREDDDLDALLAASVRVTGRPRRRRSPMR